MCRRCWRSSCRRSFSCSASAAPPARWSPHSAATLRPTGARSCSLVALAALLPLAVTIALRPAMYNGIRHFVFVLPPLAVLGGLAGAWLIEAARRSPFASRRRWLPSFCRRHRPAGASSMVRLHPYEYAHFNRLAGGVARARDRYMLDYWGLAFKQAVAGAAGQALPSGARPSPPAAAGRSRSAARIARRRSSSAPISRPPGTRRAPTSP